MPVTSINLPGRIIIVSSKIKKLSENKFFRGGILLTAATFVVGPLNYLFTSLSGKILGPSGYSEIAALFSYLGIFSVPLSVINTDVIRRLGAKRENRFDVFGKWENWLWQKIRRWKFFIIPYIFLIPAVSYITNLSTPFSFTLLILSLLSFLGVFYLAALQGLHLFFAFAALAIISVIIKLLGPIFIFFKIDGLSTISVFLILSSLSTILLAKFILSKYSISTLNQVSSHAPAIKEIIFRKEIYITILSMLGITLLSNLDIVYVKKFFPPDTAGIYAAWSLFAKIVLYILSPVTSVSFIFFSSKKEETWHSRGLAFSICLCLFVGILLYITYFFLGDFVVKLIFNNQYVSIISFLPSAAIFGSLYTFIIMLNNLALAKNSLTSLVSIIFIPLYFFSLLYFGKNIQNVISINIIIAAFISVVYISFTLLKKLA